MPCYQACDESEFVMSSWVLCGKSIVNNSDKNLVDGQESSTFNVPEELLSLESRVAIDCTYICRNWLLTKEKNGASDKSSCAELYHSKHCHLQILFYFPLPR